MTDIQPVGSETKKGAAKQKKRRSKIHSLTAYRKGETLTATGALHAGSGWFIHYGHNLISGHQRAIFKD